MRYLAASYLDEVTCRRVCAFKIVGYYFVRLNVVTYTVEEHYGNSIVYELLDGFRIGGVFAYRYEKAVNTAVEQGLHATSFSFLTLVALAYHGVVAQAVCHIIYAAYDCREEVMDHLGYYHTYCVGLAFSQSKSEGVGTVVYARRQLLHLAFGLFTDIWMVLEGSRYGR